MTYSPFETRWLLAILDVVLPRDELPGGASDAPIDQFVAHLTGVAPAQMTWGLRGAVWLVTLFAPLFILGRVRTFTALDADDRLRLMERLGENRIYFLREIPTLFKTVACLALCGLPGVQSAIGIEPVDETPPDWARE